MRKAWVDAQQDPCSFPPRLGNKGQWANSLYSGRWRSGWRNHQFRMCTKRYVESQHLVTSINEAQMWEGFNLCLSLIPTSLQGLLDTAPARAWSLACMLDRWLGLTHFGVVSMRMWQVEYEGLKLVLFKNKIPSPSWKVLHCDFLHNSYNTVTLFPTVLPAAL